MGRGAAWVGRRGVAARRGGGGRVGSCLRRYDGLILRRVTEREGAGVALLRRGAGVLALERGELVE